VGEQQHPRRRLHLRRNPTRPRTTTRSKDLHLEGTCRHYAWAIVAGVSSGNPAQADGSTSRSVASASCPPRTSARLMASVTRLWRQSASGRPGQAPVDEASFRANSASVHANTAASGSGSSQSGRGFPLTKQEKPRAARPTEPRDSYTSGIWIPHSSPSAQGNSHLVKQLS